MNSIDVIIPSYRLEAKYLVAITKMTKPAGVAVRYLIIADNPRVTIPHEVSEIVDNKHIFLFINKENLGAHGTRNVGLRNVIADWILFIDDDVIPQTDLLISYHNASVKNQDSIGFLGETLFPEPVNRFTKGILACDILTFFFIAGYYDSIKWAPTANVIIKKDAIGDILFQDIFPNNGGGEDIDFFLQINKQTKKELICLDNAKVYHEWWYEGKRNYTRFIRWSFGDSLLHRIFPEFTYYNFPNIIESLVLGGIVGIILSFYFQSLVFVPSIFLGILAGEIVVEFIRLILYKGIRQSQYVLESVLIRASNDIGRLYMQAIKLRRIKGLFERFDHFCDGRHIGHQRTWAGIKFGSYIFITLLILYFFTVNL